MRQMIVKYAGDCRTCGAALPAGSAAIYERHIGLFCLGCAPTDTEAIRTLRQEAADRKATKYEGWAAQRRDRAGAVLEHNSIYTGDTAFNTQPGHIPLRARVIKQNDRAFESLSIAREFDAKAQKLRANVRVAGDAEARRQATREACLSWIKKGMTVQTAHFGPGIVEKVNKKTATIRSTGASRNFRVNVELSFVSRPHDNHHEEED